MDTQVHCTKCDREPAAVHQMRWTRMDLQQHCTRCGQHTGTVHQTPEQCNTLAVESSPTRYSPRSFPVLQRESSGRHNRAKSTKLMRRRRIIRNNRYVKMIAVVIETTVSRSWLLWHFEKISGSAQARPCHRGPRSAPHPRGHTAEEYYSGCSDHHVFDLAPNIFLKHYDG